MTTRVWPMYLFPFFFIVFYIIIVVFVGFVNLLTLHFMFNNNSCKRIVTTDESEHM